MASIIFNKNMQTSTEVQESLKDLANKVDNASTKALVNISTLQNLDNETKENIGQGNQLNSNLEGNISSGNNLNDNLINNIKNANSTNTNLVDSSNIAISQNTELKKSLDETKKYIANLDESQNLPKMRNEITDLQNEMKNNTNINYKGTLTNSNLLPTTGNKIGDCYIINQNIWIYSANGWENVGHLQGAKGDKGEKGDKGDKGDKGESAFDLGVNLPAGANILTLESGSYLIQDALNGVVGWATYQVFKQDDTYSTIYARQIFTNESYMITKKDTETSINKLAVADGNNVFTGSNKFTQSIKAEQGIENLLNMSFLSGYGLTYNISESNYLALSYADSTGFRCGIPNKDITLRGENLKLNTYKVYHEGYKGFLNDNNIFDAPQVFRGNGNILTLRENALKAHAYFDIVDHNGIRKGFMGFGDSSNSNMYFSNSKGKVLISSANGTVVDIDNGMTINKVLMTRDFYFGSGTSRVEISPKKQDNSDYQWDKSLEFRYDIMAWAVEGKTILLSDTLQSNNLYIEKYNHVHQITGNQLNVAPYSDGTIGFEINLPYDYSKVHYCEAHITAVDGNYDDRIRATEWNCIAFKHPIKNTIKIQGKQLTGTKPTRVDVEFLIKATT